MAKNIYNVPKKTWRVWSLPAQAVFNATHKFYINNKDKMLHPKSPPLRREHWKTIAWNASWVAANTADSFETVIIE